MLWSSSPLVELRSEAEFDADLFIPGYDFYLQVQSRNTSLPSPPFRTPRTYKTLKIP